MSLCHKMKGGQPMKFLAGVLPTSHTTIAQLADIYRSGAEAVIDGDCSAVRVYAERGENGHIKALERYEKARCGAG
jgi:hypothetical protein